MRVTKGTSIEKVYDGALFEGALGPRPCLDLFLYIQWNFIFELREQSHFHWGPLFSHQKPNDKGQAQLQANNRRKQRNTIKSKQNHKQDGKTTTKKWQTINCLIII